MKKIFLSILVVLVGCFFIYNEFNDSDDKKIIDSIYSYLDTISSMELKNGSYNIFKNKLYNEHVSVDLNEFDSLSDGYLDVIDGHAVYSCLNIDSYKVVVENGKLVSKEKGKCEYLKLDDEVGVLKNYVKNYLYLISSSGIVSSGIYSVNDLNSFFPYLTEFPSDGWVLIYYDEIDGIDILKYSIKYRNKVLSLIDEVEVTDDLVDYTIYEEDIHE